MKTSSTHSQNYRFGNFEIKRTDPRLLTAKSLRVPRVANLINICHSCLGPSWPNAEGYSHSRVLTNYVEHVGDICILFRVVILQLWIKINSVLRIVGDLISCKKYDENGKSIEVFQWK